MVAQAKAIALSARQATRTTSIRPFVRISMNAQTTTGIAVPIVVARMLQRLVKWLFAGSVNQVTDDGVGSGDCNTCAADFYSDNGTCAPKKAQGEVCADNAECTSGTCNVSGFCD